MRYSITGLIAIGLSTTLLYGPVQSQIIFDRPTSGEVRVVYSHWSLEDSSGTVKIDQLTIPFTGFVPLGDNMEASVYVANSSNTLEQSGAEKTLSGLGDARLQFNRSFSNDRLLLSLGVNMPVGKKKLDAGEEMLVLQMLSQNFLNLPMRRFGEGFGFNVLVGGAEMVGPARVGGGVMYQFNGKYDPYEASGSYDPGDFVSINAGADWPSGATTISADAIFTTYLSDKLEGEKVFKQSTQVDLRLNAAYQGQSYSIRGGLGYLLRGRNSLFLPGEEQLRILGNEFLINAGLTRHIASGWSITPSAELKLIGETENGFGKCTVAGFGGAIGKSLGERITLNVGGKYFLGDADDGAVDLTGFQVTGSLAAAF
ncbi:MAG TPA: hypothetical protein VN285_00520 [Candidatus Deferrimicrobium sp.]|nr:hypothetical protein [Candidatus Deferrimicrobium sp.]